MPFAPGDLEVIWSKLAEKGVGGCSECQSRERGVIKGFVTPIISQNSEEASTVGGLKNLIPCLAILCKHCGHMSIFDIETLGLPDLYK